MGAVLYAAVDAAVDQAAVGGGAAIGEPATTIEATTVGDMNNTGNADADMDVNDMDV